MNSQVEGKVYPPVRVRLAAERVRAFAEAVGAQEGEVPPTFATAAEFASFPAVVTDPELGLDFTRVVHGEQEYEWRRGLVEGETLDATSRVASIREKGGHGFLTIETELRGADGEIAVIARATMIERGA